MMNLVDNTRFLLPGEHRDREVSPTGMYRAHLCSLGAPEPERVRIRRSCPTEVMRSVSQTHGEGQALALREG